MCKKQEYINNGECVKDDFERGVKVLGIYNDKSCCIFI